MTDDGRMVVNLSDLTLGELDEIDGLLEAEGRKPLAELLGGRGQFAATAAAACMIRRRTDPGFSYDDALKLRMGDLELQTGEALGAVHGAELPTSLASGDSTRSES